MSAAGGKAVVLDSCYPAGPCLVRYTTPAGESSEHTVCAYGGSVWPKHPSGEYRVNSAMLFAASDHLKKRGNKR